MITSGATWTEYLAKPFSMTTLLAEYHLRVADPGTRKYGRFTVLATLGTGAMGEVLRARDERLGREVAIKTVRNVFGLHADTFKRRFEAEARALAAMSHPAIVQVHDLGVDDESGEPYLVMELVDGPTLKDKLKNDGPMSAAEVRGLGIQLARALDAAHARKILHRDIKPANILLSPTGQWKLADFGVARVPDSSMTMTGQFLGTPAYAAPESVSLGEFSEASDVFAVAVTLVEALSGERVRGDASLSEIVRHSRDLIRLPATVPPDIADPLRAAMALDPATRPTAARLADLLAAGSTAAMAVAAPFAGPSGGDATAVLTGPTRPVTPLTSPGTSSAASVSVHPGDPRRRRMFWIVGSVVGLLLFIGLIAALSGDDRNSAASAPPAVVGEDDDTEAEAEREPDPQREFDEIVDEAREGNIDEALKQLDEFEERYGESEATWQLREDLERGARGKGHKKPKKRH